MKLTTKGRNAVTAMLDVCVNARNQPVNLSSIHERQGVSIHYLEQIFIKLRKAGLVKSIRGPGGGYVLSRNAKTINIAEIIKAVEDSMQITQCAGQANCKGGETCLSHNLWHTLEKLLDGFLYHVSLYDAAYSEEIISNQVVHYFNSKLNNNNYKLKISGDES